MTPKLLIQDVSEYTDLPESLERIEDVYIFDDNIRVHCASLSASLECEYLYTVLHFADDTDDDVREEIYEEHSYPDNDAIAYFDTDWSHTIDLDEDQGDDTWEEIVEYYQCNHAY